MGVLVYANECFQEKLRSYTKSGFSIGLVIGEKFEDYVYLTHLAPLPSPLDIDEITPKPASLTSVSESSVSLHASQVSRMLPGGLDVLGVYVAMPVSDSNSSAIRAKFGAILGSMHKAISKYHFGSCDKLTEKIILFGSEQNLKIVVKSVDITNHEVPLVTATLKTQETHWIQLNYNYFFTFPIYIPQEQMSQPLLKNVLTAFRPWANSLKELCVLFSGEMINDEDQVIGESETNNTPKKKEKQKGFDSIISVIDLELLEKENVLHDSSIAEFNDSFGCILFRGTISGRSYLHGKATAAEALEAVTSDLMRSLVSRWEMHCDSLVEEQGTSVAPVFHEPPRRVFLKVGDSPISLCDYLFPGDSCLDACQSAKELMDIDVQECDVDDTRETWAGPEDLEALESVFAKSVEARFEEGSYTKYSMYAVFAVLFGFLALCLPFLIRSFRDILFGRIKN